MKILNSELKISTPIVILGLGKSGLAAEQFLIRAGVARKDVLTFDEKAESQLHTWDEIQKLSPGTLVVSPGVPLQSENIQNLKTLGWQLTSEINLACSVLTDEIVIGITGSVGKSTVTSLLGEAARTQDHHAFVGGNLGTPFCEYAIGLLDLKPKAKYVILELSSYQLENCAQLKLDYSAITFLSANHLERYSSIDQYYLTKCHIGKMTKHCCILNSASADLVLYKDKVSKTYELTTIGDQKINLIGAHNLQNYYVAELIAKKCCWGPSAFQAMQNFQGLSHRLETVGRFNDVLYINDSKATAMDSVLVATTAALEKTAEHSKLFLLLGGKDKNLPWQQLNILSQKKNISFVFFGQCGQLASEKSKLEGPVFLSLAPAMSFVFEKSTAEDVVLLSPGGTSLDEFKNFEERGNFFKNTIHEFYK